MYTNFTAKKYAPHNFRVGKGEHKQRTFIKGIESALQVVFLVHLFQVFQKLFRQGPFLHRRLSATQRLI